MMIATILVALAALAIALIGAALLEVPSIRRDTALDAESFNAC